MNRQERLIAVVVLMLICVGAMAIQFGKPRLGNPGLVMEKVPLTNELGEIIRDQRAYLPANVPGFRAIDLPVTSNEATNLPPDTMYGRKAYRAKDGFSAQMTVVMMKTDRTSIHRPQLCVSGAGWDIQKTEVIDIPVPLPSPYVLKATCLTSTKMAKKEDGTKFPISGIYIYWFVSEERLVPTHELAQWAITRDLITSGTLYPWAYVSVFAVFMPGQEEAALARAKELIASTAPQFQLVPAPDGQQTAFHQKAAPLN